MKVNKKTVKAIQFASVYEGVLRDRFESNNGFFLDNNPEMWNDEEREAFDMVTEVEDKLKKAILELVGFVS